MKILVEGKGGTARLIHSIRRLCRFSQTEHELLAVDLDLSIKQIIEYYGARWKIESGFKEIKQEIGSSKSQTRNAYAVINHVNFSMMAATVTWIYGARLENTPERRHKVRGVC